MTDVSTKGLLPQLIDVLHALSESQALLLARVQTMRLEYISSEFSGWDTAGEPPDAPIATSMDVSPSPPVVALTAPMLESPKDDAVDEVECSVAPAPSTTWSPPSIASVGFGATDEPTFEGTDVGDRRSVSSEPAPSETPPCEEFAAAVLDETAPQSNPIEAPSETNHHEEPAVIDLAQIALRPNPIEAKPAHLTGFESENRNYNFFDELDARLAGLGDTRSAADSEESIEGSDQP